MLQSLLNGHDIGSDECAACEEDFNYCSCGGIIHTEYQPVFRTIASPRAKMVLRNECDRCGEDFEIS